MPLVDLRMSRGNPLPGSDKTPFPAAICAAKEGWRPDHPTTCGPRKWRPHPREIVGIGALKSRETDRSESILQISNLKFTSRWIDHGGNRTRVTGFADLCLNHSATWSHYRRWLARIACTPCCSLSA
jgi:hypothetical protein